MKGILIGGSVLLVFAIYCKMQRKNDSPKIFYPKKPLGGYNGYIVPPFGVVIKESEKENAALLEHEMVHWRQFQNEGLLRFGYNYLKEAKKVGYDGNKYEKEARTVENDYCKNNYTECVRSGWSKTVYNPEFRVV